jgi:elongation factor Ts
MTNQEKVLYIRKITMLPWSKIAEALNTSKFDVDAAVKVLLDKKQTSAEDMANRTTNAGIVYSYVHSNKVGVMVNLACQTDFVAKNELFINLAKDICMHIVAAPLVSYVSESNLNPQDLAEAKAEFARGMEKKPQSIIDKIVAGKWQKKLEEMCLLNQKFVKDDTLTIQQLIANVSATVGEKIEVKKFIKMKVD